MNTPSVNARPIPEKYTALLILALALPFFVYMGVINHYAINQPYWDDFSVVLVRVNTVLSGVGMGEQLQEIFATNAGHLPVITRLVSIVQAKYLGGINFKDSVLLGNVGWLCTTLLLLVYFRKNLQLSWANLLPVSFLMLTINHWEAMDFVTVTWQQYWGSAFFPALCLLAIVERKTTVAVYAFTGALFLSSGALALYPLALAYCALRMRWADTVSFAIRAGIVLLVFFYFSPPQTAGAPANPDYALMLKYIPEFMGNLVSTGKWDMSNIAWIHLPLGLLVIGLGAYMVIKLPDGDFSKLLFIYVMILGGMAAYLRGGGMAYPVSRYALFASLAAAGIYAVYAARLQNNPTANKWCLPAISTAAILLWMHSLYICQTPLQLNKTERLNGIQAYIQTDKDPGTFIPLFADFNYAKPVLEKANQLGIYNTVEANAANTLGEK